MTNWMIKSEALGKQYTLHRNATGTSPLAAAADGIRAIFKGKKTPAPAKEKLWAVRDVTFEISEGERVALIGANGSGKSTLLKLLSRVTEPTEGQALIRGRVNSLLEVGTGFHPDLSGRENIFLNASLLGMSRDETHRKFDMIVAFAGISRFLDEAVKHYSSGMQLRLAFSVAAHVESDILLLDEVLAVGDLVFQDQCQNKIAEIADAGTTIVFVSHALSSVAELCNRAMIFEQGHIVEDKPVKQAISHYIERARGIEGGCRQAVHYGAPETAPGNHVVRLRSVSVLQNNKPVEKAVLLNRDIEIEIIYGNLVPDSKLRVCLLISDHLGNDVFITDNIYTAKREDMVALSPQETGFYRSLCCIPAGLLNDIKYFVTLLIYDHGDVRHLLAQNVVSFDVKDDTDYSKHLVHFPADYCIRVPGTVRQNLSWHTEKAENL
ncbi:MAG: ATP-binding cassette domain-containing protein [Rhodospirillales bacterium]|nr:ATP-binding cassette domain-containing protein [Rhodospirillales bacterium]